MTLTLIYWPDIWCTYTILEFNDTFELAVVGIIVLCHFIKTDLMPVIISKNDQHLVTLYSVVFSNITGSL